MKRFLVLVLAVLFVFSVSSSFADDHMVHLACGSKAA